MKKGESTGLEDRLFHYSLEVDVARVEGDEELWVWRVNLRLPPDDGWDKYTIIAAGEAASKEAADRIGKAARRAIAVKLERSAT